MPTSTSTRLPGFDGKPTNGMAPVRKPINTIFEIWGVLVTSYRMRHE